MVNTVRFGAIEIDPQHQQAAGEAAGGQAVTSLSRLYARLALSVSRFLKNA